MKLELDIYGMSYFTGKERAIVESIYKIADEVEGLKRKNEYDDESLKQISDALGISSYRHSVHARRINRLTCEKDNMRKYGTETGGEECIEDPAPSCETCQKNVTGNSDSCNDRWCSPPSCPGYIPKASAGGAPEDLRWKLAKENVALMAKVDELQEAVEEARVIIHHVANFNDVYGVNLDRAKGWFKKHGGTG